MNRNTNALKLLALGAAAVIYCAAVIYGDIMFLQVVGKAFPQSGVFASLAIVGALVTAASAIILPLALHFWFAPGLQFIGGVIFWAVDIAALMLNSMLAFQVAAGGGLDSFLGTWALWSPATPMLAVVGWGIMFMLDPSHRVRHAQLELEADQADIYANRLKAAAKSSEVDETIRAAANQAARQFAETLNHTYVSSTNGKRANGQPASGQIEMSADSADAFPKRSKAAPKG